MIWTAIAGSLSNPNSERNSAMAVSVTGDFNTNPAYTGRFIPTIWAGKLNV